METFDTNLQSSNSISINDEIKDYFMESAKWAKFLSILGFVGLGLMVLISIVMIIFGALFNNYSNRGAQPALIAIIYIIMAVVYYFPIKNLYQFANGVKRGINANEQESFTAAIRNLKSHYKFIGILSIVIVSLYLFILLITVLMIALR